MTGNFHIDDIDAYKEYGVYLTGGSYRSLLSWPALKAVASNDWHEENGIEPDLSEPRLDSRNVSLGFAIAGGNAKFDSFMSVLSSSAYHDFRIDDLGRTWRLRMTSPSSLSVSYGLHLVSVTFADDFPLSGYEYAAPESTIDPSEDYLLDGRKLTDYGVCTLEGTLAGLMKRPAVKPNLLRNIKSRPGAIYDGDGDAVMQPKDVTLNCLLRADAIEGMWRNYNALLYDLTRPGQRRLYCKALDSEYLCFYKSSSVSESAFSGKIWLKFSVTMCVMTDV